MSHNSKCCKKCTCKYMRHPVNNTQVVESSSVHTTSILMLSILNTTCLRHSAPVPLGLWDNLEQIQFGGFELCSVSMAMRKNPINVLNVVIKSPSHCRLRGLCWNYTFEMNQNIIPGWVVCHLLRWLLEEIFRLEKCEKYSVSYESVYILVSLIFSIACMSILYGTPNAVQIQVIYKKSTYKIISRVIGLNVYSIQQYLGYHMEVLNCVLYLWRCVRIRWTY